MAAFVMLIYTQASTWCLANPAPSGASTRAPAAEHKRFDMPGFRPNRFYIRELQRFGVLPQDLPAATPVDTYAADRAYWETFQHVVPPAR